MFIKKKMPMAIFLKKMKIFGNFFWKSVKFLPIFWQSNGNFPEGQVTRCHHNPMMAVSSMSRRSHTQFSRVAVSMRRGRKRSVKWPTGMTSTWDCRCCQMDLEREIETCSNWWIYPSFVITKKITFLLQNHSSVCIVRDHGKFTLSFQQSTQSTRFNRNMFIQNL